MSSMSDSSAAELSGDFALSDIIDNVCRFLKIKDLCTVSKVCESWHRAAWNEIKKKGIEAKVMPCFKRSLVENNSSTLLDEIDTKPHVSLLFFNRLHFEVLTSDDELNYVLNTYKEQLECKIIAVNVEESYFDRNPRVRLDDSCQINKSGQHFGIPCLFLPIFKQSKLAISCCMDEDSISSVVLAQRMYEELITNDKDSKVIFIMLSAGVKGFDVATNMLAMIEKSHKQESCSIWGSECYSLYEVDYNCKKITNVQIPIFIGITICSSSIESWSFVADTSLKCEEFTEQLLKFKESIKLKCYSFGLVSGPALVPYEEAVYDVHDDNFSDLKLHDSFQFMDAIKTIFSETLFIGEFNYDFLNVYGCNSTSNVGGMISNSLYISLMIITHD